MNYFGNRHNEEFIFKRVNWQTWHEHESYNYITNGSIEYAADSDLKVTGKFDFTGYELPNTSDLIRVYYRFTDDSGESATNALATFFASYSSITYEDTLKGIKASGSLNGESMLSVLKNHKIGRPYTVRKGTYALSKVKEIILDHNLYPKFRSNNFNSAKLTSDYTFQASDDYLKVVNYLLDVARYKSISVDAEGYLITEPLLQTGDLIEFKNDDNSIMYPQLSADNAWMSTPNVVKIFYNTDTVCILAEAKNISGSRASLLNRGNRELSYVENISNVGNGSLRNLLKQKAESVLKDKSSDIEIVKFEHAWIPMKLYDTVRINYGDMSWEGSLDNFSIELSPSVKTTSKVKRVLAQDIIISSSVTVYREDQ